MIKATNGMIKAAMGAANGLDRQVVEDILNAALVCHEIERQTQFLPLNGANGADGAGDWVVSSQDGGRGRIC